jgi:hypothetical protein
LSEYRHPNTRDLDPCGIQPMVSVYVKSAVRDQIVQVSVHVTGSISNKALIRQRSVFLHFSCRDICFYLAILRVYSAICADTLDMPCLGMANVGKTIASPWIAHNSLSSLIAPFLDSYDRHRVTLCVFWGFSGFSCFCWNSNRSVSNIVQFWRRDAGSIGTPSWLGPHVYSSLQNFRPRPVISPSW